MDYSNWIGCHCFVSPISNTQPHMDLNRILLTQVKDLATRTYNLNFGCVMYKSSKEFKLSAFFVKCHRSIVLVSIHVSMKISGVNT